MLKLFTFTLILFLHYSFVAQTINDYTYSDGRVNDFTIVEDALEKRYPGYKQQAKQWRDDLTTRLKFGGGNRMGKETLIVPTVVHIVWKTPAENISDADVEAQIDALNDDFNRQNADTVNLRPIFDPIKGNPNIKFEIVAIVRKQTTADFNADIINGGLYDDIKDSTAGGSNAWNTSNYLNIWVGNLQSSGFGQILGYAYPPTGASGWPAGQSASNANDDGVVIHYPVFKTSGTFNGAAVRGRTLTHEVGHYLGLRHIWGDGDCTVDDNIDDTPIARDRSSFDCNKFKNTCRAGTPGDLPDMVENYMDYSAETCQNSFTKGQGDFMRNALTTLRPNAYYVESQGKEITSGFSLFPNPSTGIVNYRINDNELPSNLRVFNMSGKIIHTQTLEENRGVINLNHLAKGVYNVNVKGAGYKHTKKVVIYE